MVGGDRGGAAAEEGDGRMQRAERLPCLQLWVPFAWAVQLSVALYREGWSHLL